MSSQKQEAMSASWLQAASQLKIEVQAPFELHSGIFVTHWVAHLPHFGGPKGMVVGLAEPPQFQISDLHQQAAAEQGLFCSFINPRIYCSFDEERFVRTLSDWGFFGPQNRLPGWLLKA